MIEQLLVEVEDVAVGIAFAHDGNEAEDAGLDAEAFAVGLDHSLGREFGSAVEGRLNGERTVFGGGDYFGLAVNRAGGGEGQASDTLGAHGFEDVPGSDGVLLEIAAGMVGPEANVGIGGQMEHHVDSRHRFAESIEVEQVGTEEAVTRIE